MMKAKSLRAMAHGAILEMRKYETRARELFKAYEANRTDDEMRTEYLDAWIQTIEARSAADILRALADFEEDETYDEQLDRYFQRGIEHEVHDDGRDSVEISGGRDADRVRVRGDKGRASGELSDSGRRRGDVPGERESDDDVDDAAGDEVRDGGGNRCRAEGGAATDTNPSRDAVA